MTDTSGMLPNWLSEAVGDRHDPQEIAQTVGQAPEWMAIIAEAVHEAEKVLQARQSGLGPGGGFPSYNHEVARAIVAQLASLYPDLGLPKA